MSLSTATAISEECYYESESAVEGCYVVVKFVKDLDLDLMGFFARRFFVDGWEDCFCILTHRQGRGREDVGGGGLKGVAALCCAFTTSMCTCMIEDIRYPL